MFAARNNFLVVPASGGGGVPAGTYAVSNAATTAAGTSSTPLHGIYFRRSVKKIIYSGANLITVVGGGTSGTITGVRWYVISQPLYQPLPNYNIAIKNQTGFANPGGSGYEQETGLASRTFTTGAYADFTFSSPFAWTGGEIAMSFSWGQCPTNYSASGNGARVVTASSGGVGVGWNTWTDSAGTYFKTDSATTVLTTIPIIEFIFG